jgi:hypothetical protein
MIAATTSHKGSEERSRVVAMSMRRGDDSERSDQYREEQLRHEPNESREPPCRKKLAMSERSCSAISLDALLMLRLLWARMRTKAHSTLNRAPCECCGHSGDHGPEVAPNRNFLIYEVVCVNIAYNNLHAFLVLFYQHYVH